MVAIRYIDEDRSIVLKKADKGSCVEFSDSDDYVSEADKQISDKAIYKNVSFSEKILRDLVTSSKKIFNSLHRKGATERHPKF